MSEEKPPRWKSEVAPRDPAPPEPIKIDTGTTAATGVDATKVQTSSTEASPTDPAGGAAKPLVPFKKPVPKQAIMIGIAGGAVLGALLAWGVLSIVWWRRDVNQEADFAAEVKAQQEAEARKKQTELDDAMRQFSIQSGKRK